MRSADEVVTLFDRLREQGGHHKERMREMAQVNNGDIAIPLPELSSVDRSSVVNYAYRGLQTMSQNMSSVAPVTMFGPLKATEGERRAARTRMNVAAYWDQKDRMALLDAQRARYLFGYGTSPVRVDVNLLEERPVLSVPSPLTTYAPQPSQANDITPPFAIAAMQMSASGLVARYGANVQVLLKAAGSMKENPHELFWVLEYADAEEFHLVLGQKVVNDRMSSRYIGEEAHGGGVTLTRMPNRAGISPWVCPGLINLDKMQGHFDQILGMYHAQSVLTALELQHAARSVFQETWLVARPGETPQIMTPADPITGQIGEVRGADIQTIAPDPQFHTHMVQDRLQEAALMTAGIPPDMLGRSASNVRTGRRGSEILSAAQDPALQEAQSIMAESKIEEKRRQIEFDKAYFRKSKSIMVTWSGRVEQVEYEAGELWKTNECLIKYPMPGMDSSSLIIMVGQLIGMDLLSKSEARQMLPFFDDPDSSADLVVTETLQRAFLEQLGAMVQSPDSPLQPRHVARLIKLVRDKDMDLIDAFEKVQEEAQKEQATPVPAEDPMAAAPGLDGPGALPPPVEGPNLGTDNVADLFGRLRMPSMTVNTPTGGRA